LFVALPDQRSRLDRTRWTCFDAALIGVSTIIDSIALSADDEAHLDTTIQKIAESHGYVSNLMQTLVLAPQGLAAFAELSSYTRYGSHLTELQRQLAIVVAVRDIHYGWTHHAPLAQSVGVTNEQLMLIREGRLPKDLAPAERALCHYAFEITGGRRVPQHVAETVRDNFTPRQIVDIALLTAFSMAVAGLAMGLEVSVEPPETLRFELNWQQYKAKVRA
jgi:alkylhydroperoxidase family enzyme